MTAATPRQFGLWDSPLTPAMLAGGKRLSDVQFDDATGSLVWLEGRSGQGVLLASATDAHAPRELTAEKSVRAEVGYGGGDFTASAGLVVYAVHREGRLYRQRLGAGLGEPITPRFGQAASPVLHPNGQWVAYVHTDEGVDRLVAVDVEGKCWPRVLTGGSDFLMQPTFSADGKHIAWIAWDHPAMPWDRSRIMLADVGPGDDGLPRLTAVRTLVGGVDEAGLFQPAFAPDGRSVYFVGDQTGWGRLGRIALEGGEIQWLSPEGVELARPAWSHGLRTFAVHPDGTWAVARATREGFARLVRVDLSGGGIQPIDALSEYTSVSQPAFSPDGQRVALVGSSAKVPARVLTWEPGDDRVTIHARSDGETVPPDDLADCEPVSWATDDGEQAHGLLWRPHSRRFAGAGRWPTVVLVHGGPTSATEAGWVDVAQFFATRGWGVLAVNYRGSTGYGREYMLKLRRNWGVNDVADACSGLAHLVDRGWADPERGVILGGSAGGFTVLQTMIDRPAVFAAGVCLFGVSNQFTLAARTHKFESRYLDSILGPLPESAAVYRERSPIFHAEKIRKPVAIFQGDEDRVVPREQADTIVEALRRSGAPHVYHVYEGEGHGWRKRETIEHFWSSADEFLRDNVLYA